MPLEIIRNDITKVRADAIVNSTNSAYRADGGSDFAIHKAAGPELDEACSKLAPLKPGDAVVTGAYKLNAKYIIHTSAPVWGEDENPEYLLGRCYESCLRQAGELQCESIAFPLISSGTYGCPKETALKVATASIKAFLEDNEMYVYLVVYDKKAFQISASLDKEISQFIDDAYVDAHRESVNRNFFLKPRAIRSLRRAAAEQDEPDADAFRVGACPKEASSPAYAAVVSDYLEPYKVDEGFSDMLLRKIDEAGLKDSEVYKRANVSKQTFSKIKCNKAIIPQKTTVLAFAVALKLDLEETRELLDKAGYSLSRSFLLDVIVEHFIKEGNYDIFEINNVLFDKDQKLLGTN